MTSPVQDRRQGQARDPTTLRKPQAQERTLPSRIT